MFIVQVFVHLFISLLLFPFRFFFPKKKFSFFVYLRCHNSKYLKIFYYIIHITSCSLIFYLRLFMFYDLRVYVQYKHNSMAKFIVKRKFMWLRKFYNFFGFCLFFLLPVLKAHSVPIYRGYYSVLPPQPPPPSPQHKIIFFYLGTHSLLREHIFVILLNSKPK